MPDTALEEAVTKAQEQVEKDIAPAEPTTPTEPPKEPSKETPKEGADEYGLTPREQVEAKQLLAAIKDPTKAPIIIDFLAKQIGYQPPETKKEAAAQSKDIVQELKESLGPELEYIAEKMGPVIKKHLDDQVDAARAESQGHINQIQSEKLENQFDKVQRGLAKQYFSDGEIPEKLGQEMLSVMDVFGPTQNQTPEQYLEDVMFVAARRTGTEVKKLEQQQKIERSRNNVPSRLQESRVQPRAAELAPLKSQTRMTLKDSILAAMSKVQDES